MILPPRFSGFPMISHRRTLRPRTLRPRTLRPRTLLRGSSLPQIAALGAACGFGLTLPAQAQRPAPGAPLATPGAMTENVPRLNIPGVTAPLTPGGAIIAPVAAPNISILVLAFDALDTPESALPVLPPAPGAVAGTAAGTTPGTALIPPAPGALPKSALAPAALRFSPAMKPGAMAPTWAALAQKKGKPDKDDNLFKPTPETGMVQPHLPQPSLNPAPVPGTALGNPTGTAAGTLAAPATPGAPLVPGAPLFPPNSPVVSSAPGDGSPQGRAQLAAVPLRRALMALGWNDVLATTPNGTTVSHAVLDRRLTLRTLNVLRQSLSQIAGAGAAPPSVQATQTALDAASGIGQALGYRAVVVLYVAPATAQTAAQGTAQGTAPAMAQRAAFSLLLSDTTREVGEPILFDESGADENSLREAGASTAAALINKALRAWPLAAPEERAALAQKHVTAARAFLAADNDLAAQEELNQAIALDASRSQPWILLGDLLATSDAAGAASAYRHAVELDAKDGLTWTKIAAALSSSEVPNWPRAIEAGNKALAANYDSAELRVAMATAQFGRADLFRTAERFDRAEDAEQEARKHLDRALELSPDDPSAVRLLAGRLVQAGRFSEASQTLDRIAPRFPNDIEIQSQYAAALLPQVGREEDAFVAFSRVWKLSGQKLVSIDELTYRALMQGFDARVYDLGKSAIQLTTGVANGALPRESALIQLTRLKEDMDAAANAIAVLRPSALVPPERLAARAFAADLMVQALEAQQIYLETGQEQQRMRGTQYTRQAVAQLNAVTGG